jgi:hypothetical protein
MGLTFRQFARLPNHLEDDMTRPVWSVLALLLLSVSLLAQETSGTSGSGESGTSGSTSGSSGEGSGTTTEGTEAPPTVPPTLEELLEDAPPIKRVEEDWEILVAEPDGAADLPQIVTVFGPTDASWGTHTVFEINHGTQPAFSEGGMQLQAWWQDYLIGYKGQFAPAELEIAGELVKFTTVTQLTEYYLVMEITGGHSETWGAFGNNSHLRLRLFTTRDDLNPYDPNNSLQHSRVTFGANRVNRFVRRAIRFYDAEGLYAEDTTPKYVHRLATDVTGEQ